MKKLFFGLACVIFAPSKSTWAQETVIDKFSGTPPMPGSIRNLAWGEAPEEYTVQAGDSLFDICEQLLGDGNYWPKLWATNPEVKNPHFIHPGTKLRFFGGDLDNPPYLEVISEDEVLPVNHSKINPDELLTEKIKTVELGGLREESPPIEIIGPNQLEVNSEVTDTFEFVGYRDPQRDAQVTIPGFILKDEIEPVGTIIVGTEGELAPNELSQVFFEYEIQPTPDTLYTILRPEQKIFHPQSGDFIGYRYSYIGTVRLIKSDPENTVAAAKVERQRLSTKTGDLVVAYLSTNRPVSTYETIKPSGNSSAVVLGFDFDEQRFANAGHFVFLENQGLTSGQFLPIYQTNGRMQNGIGGAKFPDTKLIKTIGVIQIIDTSQAAALGYIISSTREILIGDKLSF